ncbi:MAG TPA: cupin domain-containing protein [Ignavibacteria bacterium]|nr:cupin domain-containing protein [Ignavibacteria bacterium]
MNDKVEKLIHSLNLEPHPEGGYFRETYRSSETAYISAKYQGLRNLNTAIYYLLTKNDISKFHRLKCDELWHHYDGGILSIYIFNPEGTLEIIELGNDNNFQVIVKKGQWFAARVTDGDYVLSGCTTAPGFDYSDFEIADSETLLKQYPEYEKIIKEFF